MITRLSHQIHRLIPDSMYTDEETYRKARLCITLPILTSPVGIIYGFVYYEVFDLPIGAVVAAIGVSQLWFSIVILNRWKSLTWAAHNIVSVFFWVIASFVYFTGGFSLGSGVIAWELCIPVVAALLCSSRASITWFAVVLIGMSVLGTAEILGFDCPRLLKPEYRTISNVLGLIGLVCIAFLFTREFYRAYAISQQRLLQLNADLERIILERTIELERTLERESSLSKFKTEFVVQASHELRTPLTVVQMGVAMLERYGAKMKPEERTARFERIHGGIDRLVTLLDNLLEIESITKKSLLKKPS